MIKKYVFGQPADTGAVIQNITAAKGEIKYLIQEIQSDQIHFSYHLDETDQVFGLGEQVRGINKRGFTYISYATDDPIHTENKHSLYGAHNFLVVKGTDCFGLYIDSPGKVTFDIGEQSRNRMLITTGTDITLYIIDGDSPKDIVSQFRRMIGKSYVPPKWAFGYQQSRWGYQTADDVRNVVNNHHQRNIPLDAVYMDIDYMDNYKDFTVDTNKFPDFTNFVSEMREQGIHLVPIIDAGVKIEDGYDVYEEGVKNNYFCKDEDGKDFVAAVWPGKVHFPDFMKPDARKWFGHKYQVLLDQGIDGFWNDMNEPAIFYSEKQLKETFEKINEYKDKNLDLTAFFGLKDLIGGLSNSIIDYKSMYHDVEGQKVCHDTIHNMYGYQMTRAAAEAFEEMVPDKRILLFSRSSHIGMHRYGGIWTGDNQSWWQQLQQSVMQMPSLNMCGFIYTGSDIGGFGSDTTEELLMRWIEFGIFTPLMRNHSAMGTRDQEVYRFDAISDFRNLIRLRYALMPYLYSEYMKAVLHDTCLFLPLAFEYPDDQAACQVEDQLMVGESIMIAPVYTQNAVGRYVYLPEDMLMLRMRSPEDMDQISMEKGHHYINVALNEVVMFIRKDHAIPILEPDEAICSIEDIKTAPLKWIKNSAEQIEYKMYEDTIPESKNISEVHFVSYNI